MDSVADPDFYPFRISDPKTATNERGEKNLLSDLFFVATNFTELDPGVKKASDPGSGSATLVVDT